MSIGLLLATQVAAQAASFDCGRASSAVEKIICSDDELSSLDEQLAALYKKALLERKDRETVRRSQRQWMAIRNDCEDRICIHRVYAERINVLYGRLNRGRQQDQSPFKYWIVDGSRQPLCESLVNRMNAEIKRLKPGGALCGYDVLRSTPGVVLPRWSKLDIQEHKALYERFVLANLVRSDAYPKIFRTTSERGFVIRMPTKEEMTYGREAFDTKPGRKMDEEVLALAWKEAIAFGTGLYKMDGVFSGADKNDVLLIEVSTVDQYHSNDSCPHFRFARFSADLGYPKPLGTAISSWTNRPMGLPFEFAGKKLVFGETLSDQPRLSNGVTASVPNGPLLCQIQGNLWFTP